MVHPDTYVTKTPEGLGLFAARKFRQGEILWIIDDFDLKLSLNGYRNLGPVSKAKFNTYSYMDYEHRVIVPWDEGKYVNHSCAPNSTGLLQYDNISIALRDIEQDEEILEDYYSYFGHFETFACQCGSPDCRKTIKQENTYDPSLRLDLNQVAGLILGQPQYLLGVDALENKNIGAFIESFRRKNARWA